jgi:hypothetical protein
MPNYLILSCDGGGIRGLLTALVLRKLHEDQNHRLLDRIDFVAGTSTGGILALGIAGDVRFDTVVDLYRTKGEAIFQPFVPPIGKKNQVADFLTNRLLDLGDDPETKAFAESLLKSKNALWYPRYDNTGLAAVVRGIFPTNPTLESLGSGKRVLVTTLRLRSEKDRWSPVALHNFPPGEASPGDTEVRPEETHVVEAALCTSAAPLYFPPFEHPRLGYCVDGGLFANNPGTLALAKAVRDGRPLESIRMLSIGTGGTNHSMPIPHLPLLKLKERNYGIMAWLFPSRVGPTPAFPLLSALMEAGASADSYVCRQILGDNYRRVQPPLSAEIGLDEFKRVDLLEAAAAEYFKTPEWEATSKWVGARFQK